MDLTGVEATHPCRIRHVPASRLLWNVHVHRWKLGSEDLGCHPPEARHLPELFGYTLVAGMVFHLLEDHEMRGLAENQAKTKPLATTSKCRNAVSAWGYGEMQVGPRLVTHLARRPSLTWRTFTPLSPTHRSFPRYGT